MSNAWDHAAGMADKHASSGGVFVRLANDGERVVGAFCGEPHPREVVWADDHYEDFDPKLHDGKRPTLRVAINFFVPAENAMKVYEGGTVWFKDVLKLRAKYGLDKWLFEIQRHGEAGNPKTKYSILPEEKIDEAMHARIEAAALHDLAEIVGGSDARDDGPISSEDADELVLRCKALPRSDVDKLLTQFGVQRIRDIKASDASQARELVAGLEDAMQAAAAAAQPEVDPFA